MVVEPRHCVTLQDDELVVSVELPGCSSANSVALDVAPTSLELSEPTMGYVLRASFPCTVDHSLAVAKYDKRARVLTVRARVRSGGASPVAEALSPSARPDMHSLLQTGWKLQDLDELLAALCVSAAGVQQSHFDDCSYANIRAAGLSLCFDGVEQAARRLACIHLFAGGKDGYSACALALPLHLHFGMVGKDVVETLGEPEKKSGGGKSAMLLVYPRLGVQITLAPSDWNAGKASPVEAVDLFAPTDSG